MSKRLSEERCKDGRVSSDEDGRVSSDEEVTVLGSQPSQSKRKKTEETISNNRLSLMYSDNETAGKVKHIHMKNFMCHASMDIVLNPSVSFIVGRNGSGKSAILTALTIGLGARAVTTNRGSSLKDFIKDGANLATVKITLSNSGPYAFKPEIYGNQVTVMRTISRVNGVSTYKLKNGYGEVMRIKKEEVDQIVHGLNIQIDNPVCVLNQDTARKFLNSRDPNDQYMLFMKATSMILLRERYEHTLNNKNACTARLLCNLKELEHLAREVRQWEHKWKLSQSIETYRERKRHLQNELYWAVACQKEREYEKQKQQMEEQQSLCPKLLDKVEEKQNEMTSIKTNISELDEELITLRRQCSEAEESFKRRKEDLRLKKEKYAVTYRTIEALKREITRRKTEIHNLESELQRIKSMSQPEYVKKKAELKKRIQGMEEREMELQSVIKMRESHYGKLKLDCQKTVADIYVFTVELKELNVNIEKKKHEISGLKRGSNNSMTIFGHKIPHLLQKIDQAHQQGKFCRKPIGPVGAFIKLKDASWAPAVESVIRSILHSFCVHNQQDLQQLYKIFMEVYGTERKPQVVTSKFFDKVHDVTKYAVKCQQYSNMLDMLIVDNPVVANCIIDQLEVETILLIPTSEEAYRIMSNAANVPRNCKRAVTKQSHLFFPDPNYKSYAGDGNKNARFLQVSMQQAIKDAESALQELQQQRTIAEKNLKAANKRNEDAQREVSQVDAEMAKLKWDCQKLNSQLMKLRDFEEPDTSSIATLTEEADRQRELLASETAEYEQVQKELKECTVEQETVKSECEKLRSDVSGFQRKEQAIVLQKRKLENELEIIESKKERCEKQYNDQCRSLRQLQKNLEMMEEQVKKVVDDANIVCPRIDTQRTPEAVQKELNDCTTYIESVEKESGTPQDINKMYLEKRKQYDTIEMTISIMKQTFELLGTLLKERQKRYHMILRMVVSRVQHAFQFLLHKRNYKGDVIIDVSKKTLRLAAESTSSGAQISDPMNLSGGERSYFTVALIMALWDFVEPPFYVLDEFDVFMDKVNRRVVMDLLLAHAQETKQHQYIFLTPQDASNVTPTTDISILRMEDPRNSAASSSGVQ